MEDENNEESHGTGKFGNQLTSDHTDFGFTHAEIMQSRGYKKKKKEKKKL